MVNGCRSLTRVHDGILIHLDLEAWPKDVPLPDGTTLVETGDGPFWPYWKIYLEADRTVEKVTGWFVVPHPTAEDTLEWYQAKLEKLGWVQVECADTLPTWAMVRYCRPKTDVAPETYVVISIRRNRYLNRIEPMIRRVTIHPWPLSGEEEGEMGVEQEPFAGESTVDDYESGEDAVELEMALPHSGD